jgi:hypothetical protein
VSRRTKELPGTLEKEKRRRKERKGTLKAGQIEKDAKEDVVCGYQMHLHSIGDLN